VRAARACGGVSAMRSRGIVACVRWPSRVFLAAALSGAPSTVHALLTGRDPLTATRAAATLLPRRGSAATDLPCGCSAAAAHRPSRQEFPRGTPLISRYQEGLTILAGVVVHLGISVFWATVIVAVDRRLRQSGRAVAGDTSDRRSGAMVWRHRLGVIGRMVDLGRWPGPVGSPVDRTDRLGRVGRAARKRGLGPIGGAVAGLMIGLVDLEIIGRRYPAIQQLPRIPQYVDHMVFGMLVVTGRGGSAGVALQHSAAVGGESHVDSPRECAHSTNHPDEAQRKSLRDAMSFASCRGLPRQERSET
jgi:hypothetical protein